MLDDKEVTFETGPPETETSQLSQPQKISLYVGNNNFQHA